MKKVLALVAVLGVAFVWGCVPQKLQDTPGDIIEEVVYPEEPQPGDDEGQSGDESGTGNSLAAIPVMAPSVTGQIDAVSLTEEQQAYNRAVNRFAYKMLGELYEGQSTVLSPLSLQMVLSMVVNGAEGETAYEIMETLGLGNVGMVALNEYSKVLLEQLPAVDNTTIVKLANAIFVNEGYKLVPEYQAQMESSYYAPVINLPFDEGEQVKAAVNDWGSRNTRGLIPEILEDNVSGNDRAYLVNALYFKGQWLDRYLPEYNVVPAPFYANAETIEKDYLCSVESLNYGEGRSFRMVRRDFGDMKPRQIKSNYSIAILLPKETATVTDVFQECQEKDWVDVCAALKREYIALRIPRFETAGSYDLVESLSAMGIKRAFEESAQFHKMVYEDIFLSKVLQKAKLTLDETGVEGAAMTLAEMMASSSGEEPQPIEFYADRPFVYTIYERTSGTILFAGVFDGK